VQFPACDLGDSTNPNERSAYPWLWRKAPEIRSTARDRLSKRSAFFAERPGFAQPEVSC